MRHSLVHYPLSRYVATYGIARLDRGVSILVIEARLENELSLSSRNLWFVDSGRDWASTESEMCGVRGYETEQRGGK